ncbi:MAG: hypothetical protein RIT81_47090 [Deltaproteobacteria bacterium]
MPAVECMIRVGDEEVTDFYRYLKKVEVRMSRTAATTCTIEIDTFRDEKGLWFVQDSNVFEPWSTLVVEAQFGRRVEEVMRGYVKAIDVTHPNEMAGSVVVIKGQDDSLRLDREHVRRVWSREDEPLSDGDIASEIASDNDLNSDTEGGLENRSLNQDGTSIDFLRRRAEANGFELFFREGVLNFHSARLDEEPQPPIMLYAGALTNCLSWSVQHDGHLPDGVRVVRQATDESSAESEDVDPDLVLLGRRAATSASMGLPSFRWTMDRPRGSASEEALVRARAAANRNAWKISATGELDGARYGHVLLTHKTVPVDGVGDAYGGTYYVDEVTHMFSMDGYRQRFKLLRNATGDRSSER